MRVKCGMPFGVRRESPLWIFLFSPRHLPVCNSRVSMQENEKSKAAILAALQNSSRRRNRLHHILFQQPHLLEEVVLLAAHRALEEARQVAEHAGFAAPLREVGEAQDVEQQRGGEERVAALPEE